MWTDLETLIRVAKEGDETQLETARRLGAAHLERARAPGMPAVDYIGGHQVSPAVTVALLDLLAGKAVMPPGPVWPPRSVGALERP